MNVHFIEDLNVMVMVRWTFLKILVESMELQNHQQIQMFTKRVLSCLAKSYLWFLRS